MTRGRRRDHGFAVVARYGSRDHECVAECATEDEAIAFAKQYFVCTAEWDGDRWMMLHAAREYGERIWHNIPYDRIVTYVLRARHRAATPPPRPPLRSLPLGSYPQRHVSASVLVDALNALPTVPPGTRPARVVHVVAY